MLFWMLDLAVHVYQLDEDGAGDEMDGEDEIATYKEWTLPSRWGAYNLHSLLPGLYKLHSVYLGLYKLHSVYRELGSAWFQPLKLKCDLPVSQFALSNSACAAMSRDFHGQWESLVFDSDVKRRLTKYAGNALLFSERGVNPNLISWNRVVLLHGGGDVQLL